MAADFGKEAGAFNFRTKWSKKNIHAKLPDHEDEDITFLGNHIPNKKTHPRRPESYLY
jgi:hypothetical protein